MIFSIGASLFLSFLIIFARIARLACQRQLKPLFAFLNAAGDLQKPSCGLDKTFSKFSHVVVAQQILGKTGICLRVFDITLAFRLINRLNLRTEDSVQQIDQLVERNLRSGGNIKDRGGRQRDLSRTKVRFDDVLNVREIARLRPIPEDDRTAPFRQLPDEQGNHGGVLAVKILTRTEYVEIAKRDGFE